MFVELTSTYRDHDGSTKEQKFLMDFASGWEIYDNGDQPAHWVNNNMGMNKSVKETYHQIKNRLYTSGLFNDGRMC